MRDLLMWGRFMPQFSHLTHHTKHLPNCFSDARQFANNSRLDLFDLGKDKVVILGNFNDVQLTCRRLVAIISIRARHTVQSGKVVLASAPD